MSKKIDHVFWAFVLLAALAAVATTLNISRGFSATAPNAELYGELDQFGRVLEHIRDDYVEKPDDAMLIESAINGMLAALDPHSSYMNAKAYREMQVQTRGEFGGLGIEVTMEVGVLKVVSPIDDTPAAKAGLQANDVITHIDGEVIAGLTLGEAVTVLIALSLVFVEPTLAEKLGQTTGWGASFEWTWLLLQWPLVFVLISTGIGLVYYFGPDADQDWVWITPGAVAATVLWLVVSLLFKLYVARFTDYEGSYGTVGGVIVVLLWFYVSGIAILTGAELNAEIEHASPYGKAPGQKNAQGKLLIGARAARAYQQRPRSGELVPARPAPSTPPPRPKLGLSAVVASAILLTKWWNQRGGRIGKPSKV